MPRLSVNKAYPMSAMPPAEIERQLAFNFTTLSKASSEVILALTCADSAFHHVGEEKRCIIATVHKSSSVGGITVGSTGAVSIKSSNTGVMATHLVCK